MSGTEWNPLDNAARCKQYPSSRFDGTANEYEHHLAGTGKTARNVRRRMFMVTWFLKFIDDRNLLLLSDVTASHVYQAFNESSDKIAFKRSVGHFLKYAYKRNMLKENLSLIIPSAVRHKAVPSVYTPEEVEKVLATFDRSTELGKRDYAISLIAARCGIRACDIAGLKFNDIRKSTSKIHIVQQKTKEPLILPLLDDVCEAIEEYTQNARGSSSNEHIFLNVASGGRPITAGNIYQIVRKAFDKSGIDCRKRRKGPHALRASLATALLNEGNDLPTIQQVLGQSSIRSAKHYVKVGIENLTALFAAREENPFLFENNYKDSKRNCVGHRRNNSWTERNFLRILKEAGIEQPAKSRNERGICIHCLRHTFRVDSYRKQDIHGDGNYRVMPLISTYVGHKGLLETQRYVHLTNETASDIVGKTSAKYKGLFPEVPK